jgi:hypothetical protein
MKTAVHKVSVSSVSLWFVVTNEIA